MSKSVVITEKGATYYEEIDQYELILKKEKGIKLSGEDLYNIAMTLKNDTNKVIVKVDDDFREDFNIYEESYRLDAFNREYGEEYSSAIREITITDRKAGRIVLTRVATMFLSAVEDEKAFSKFEESVIREVLSTIKKRGEI